MSARTTSLPRPTLPARRQAGLFTRLAAAFALYSERRRLAELPDHMLDDIGISRSEANAEARREIWDAPQHWWL